MNDEKILERILNELGHLREEVHDIRLQQTQLDGKISVIDVKLNTHLVHHEKQHQDRDSRWKNTGIAAAIGFGFFSALNLIIEFISRIRG